MHKHLHLPFQSHLNKAKILWEHQLNKLISDLSSRPHTSVLLLFTPQVHDLLSPNSSPASRSTHLIALLSDQLHPPSAAVQTDWWPVQPSRVRLLHHSDLVSGCSAGDETKEWVTWPSRSSWPHKLEADSVFSGAEECALHYTQSAVAQLTSRPEAYSVCEQGKYFSSHSEPIKGHKSTHTQLRPSILK